MRLVRTALLAAVMAVAVACVGDDSERTPVEPVAPLTEPPETTTEATSTTVTPAASAGQRLGTSGRSGNARDNDPHLHFGTSHPTTPEDWAVRRGQVDPVPHLEAGRQGEPRSPADELGLR